MTLQQCCCCCKLENGAFIWGVLTSLANIIVFCILNAAKSSLRGMDEWIIFFQIALIVEIVASILLAVGAVAVSIHKK